MALARQLQGRREGRALGVTAAAGSLAVHTGSHFTLQAVHMHVLTAPTATSHCWYSHCLTPRQDPLLSQQTNLMLFLAFHL